MSDSLLNLLEVLNEVLEEQKLQEQASGGAPTEDELWNIVSPGLEEVINDRYGDRYKKYVTKIKEELRNKNFSVALGIINSQYKYEKGQGVGDKPKKIYNWLEKLNVFYALNQSKKAVVNPATLKAIETGVLFQRTLKLSRGVLPVKTNTDLMSHIFANRPLFGNKPIANSRSAQGNQRNMLSRLIANLSQGEPSYGFILTAPEGNSPYGLAEEFKVLDLKDFEKLITISKTGDLSKTSNILNATKKLSSEALKISFIKQIQKSYSEIFKFFIENQEKLLEYREAIINCIDYFNSSVKFEKEGQPAITSPRFPEHKEFINDWIKRFSFKYQGILAGSSSRDEKEYQRNLGKSITQPPIKTSAGSLAKGFRNALKYFFEDATGFKERIDIFNEKMKLFTLPKEKFQNRVKTLEYLPYSVYGGSEEARQEEEQHVDILDLINRVVVMDYFVEFSKGFSAPIAGLMFEYFLAGLVGGEVVGQRGDVVDFQVGDSLGSAKFISSLKYAAQSAKSFEVEEVLGKKVTYVVGLKKASDFKLEDSGVAPLEIQEVDIYTFDIIHKGGLVFSVDDGKDEDLKNPQRENKNLSLVSGEIRFNKILEEKPPITTIKVMSTDGKGIKGYRKTLGALLDGSDDSVTQWYQQTLKKIEEIFDKIKGGESDARDYVQTGEKRSGENAMKQLYDSREGIASLGDVGGYQFKARKPKPNDA